MEADQLTGIKPSLKGRVLNSFLPTEEAGSAEMSSTQSYQHAKMRSYTLRELLNALVTLSQIPVPASLAGTSRLQKKISYRHTYT